MLYKLDRRLLSLRPIAGRPRAKFFSPQVHRVRRKKEQVQRAKSESPSRKDRQPLGLKELFVLSKQTNDLPPDPNAIQPHCRGHDFHSPMMRWRCGRSWDTPDGPRVRTPFACPRLPQNPGRVPTRNTGGPSASPRRLAHVRPERIGPLAVSTLSRHLSPAWNTKETRHIRKIRFRLGTRRFTARQW